MVSALSDSSESDRIATVIETSVNAGVPQGARRLIWDVFFAQAGRGVSFAAHLPWADAPDTRSVTIGSDEALGALVMRPARQPGVAMIGFVCVNADARGRGHAAALMARAEEALGAAGSIATLLWTSKPQVYTGRGYRIIDRDRFLTVSAHGPTPPGTVRAEAWPGAGDEAGLPAFATAGERLSGAHATAVIVHGRGGVTLVDWTGEPGAVAALIGAAGHARWSVNLPQQSRFDKGFDPALFTIEESEGAFAMVRSADPSLVINPVSLADRI